MSDSDTTIADTWAPRLQALQVAAEVLLAELAQRAIANGSHRDDVHGYFMDADDRLTAVLAELEDLAGRLRDGGQL